MSRQWQLRSLAEPMAIPAGIGTLDAWLCHLETLHPQKIDLSLDRVAKVAQRLGVRPATPQTITVAGTNGKGSCVAAIAALLSAQDISVGCYTSPHLLRFNERITVNGAAADDQEIMAAFAEIESARGDISLSYFEFATLAALVIFRWRNVTYQILEVGLGGRLDAVNLIDADACVITSIGLDHTEMLGDTRDLIAIEKAAVARSGRPAVVAELDPPASLIPAIEEAGGDILLLGREWQLQDAAVTLPDGSVFGLPKLASLQPSNLGAAITVLWSLGKLPSEEQGSVALNHLAVPGRQQRVVHEGRRWLFDVAHNEESVNCLAAALEAEPHSAGTHFVFGAMVDKPLRAMLARLMPLATTWHLPTHEDVPRAAQPSYLAEHIAELDPEARIYEYASPQGAYEAVLDMAAANDRIVVFGSFITVGAQMHCLQVKAAAGASS